MTESAQPVEGLVDARGAAALLGIPSDSYKRITTWHAKKNAAAKEGESPRGIVGAFPDPAGTLNGAVWRVADILAFKETDAARGINSPGRPKKNPGAGDA